MIEPPALSPRGAELSALIAGAGDGVLWLARQLEAECRGPIERARGLGSEIAPLLAALPESAREGYVKDLGKVFGLGVKTVREALEAAVPSAAPAPSSAPANQGGPGNPAGYPAETLRALDQVSERHCVLLNGGAVWVARKAADPITDEETLEFLTFGDFSRFLGNRTVWINDPVDGGLKREELPKVWLKAPPGIRPEYEGLVFSPQQETDARFLNLWRGLAVTARRGSCARYWKHVQDVICLGNPDLYLYVRRWMAHAVQKPWEIPGVAIVMRGLQGIGKGKFVEWFGELFGLHFLPVASMDLVSGRFNSHLARVLVLYADEAMWGGDRSREGLLKALVTEKWVTVEAKGKDAFRVRNYKRLLVATNNSWPLPRDRDDRRTIVIDVPDTHKEDRPYFEAIDREMKSGGLEALLWDLQHEDLTDFDPGVRPDVDHGFDMKLRSASGPIQWWHQVLVDGVQVKDATKDIGDEITQWHGRPQVDDLYALYLTWATKIQHRHIESREHWARELRTVCPHLAVGRSWVTGGPRGREYKLGTLEQCRAAFEAAFRVGPEIWGEDEEEEEI